MDPSNTTDATSAPSLSTINTSFLVNTLLTSAKITAVSLFCIYAGSHASLRRPPSASPPRKTKSARSSTPRILPPDRDDDRPLVDGLQPSDAIVMPVMGAGVLIGLYYLIQWLQDPAVLNAVLRGYLSLASLAGMTVLFADAFYLVCGLVFVRAWRDWEGRLWEVDERRMGWRDADGGELVRGSPLPGWLGRSFGGKRLWAMRNLLMNRWAVVLTLGDHKKALRFRCGSILTAVAAQLVVFGYYLAPGSNFLSNIVGCGLCYGTLMLMSPTTFLTGTTVLAGLFVYDIVMVFYTPFMVGVATKLDAPIKLTFAHAHGSSLIGLGDIVLPGIFVALALRFDHWRFYDRQVKTVQQVLVTETLDERTGEKQEAAEMGERRVKPEYVDTSSSLGSRLWSYPWARMLGKKIEGRAQPDESTSDVSEDVSLTSEEKLVMDKAMAMDDPEASDEVEDERSSQGESSSLGSWTKTPKMLPDEKTVPAAPEPETTAQVQVSEDDAEETPKPRYLAAASFSKPYFWACIVGYTIGMAATLVALVVSQRGQPALLYLVPGVVLSTWTLGWWRGELGLLWEYTEDGSLDTKDVVVTTETARGETKVVGSGEKGGEEVEQRGCKGGAAEEGHERLISEAMESDIAEKKGDGSSGNVENKGAGKESEGLFVLPQEVAFSFMILTPEPRR